MAPTDDREQLVEQMAWITERVHLIPVHRRRHASTVRARVEAMVPAEGTPTPNGPTPQHSSTDPSSEERSR